MKIVSVSGVMTVNTIISYEIITKIGGARLFKHLQTKIHLFMILCVSSIGLSTLTSETLHRSWTSLALCVLLCSVDAVGFYRSLLTAHPIPCLCS